MHAYVHYNTSHSSKDTESIKCPSVIDWINKYGTYRSWNTMQP